MSKKELKSFSYDEADKSLGRAEEAIAEYEQVLPNGMAGSDRAYLQCYKVYDSLMSLCRDLNSEEQASAAAAVKRQVVADHIAPMP